MKITYDENNKPKTVQSLGFCLATGFLIGAVVVAAAMSAPSVLADGQIFEYVTPSGTVNLTNVPAGSRFKELEPSVRYHRAVSDVELEQAVARAAHQHRISPALLLAVMKAESDFNPMVISKAGAVGLMQLIPETAIRHGVRNLYDTEDNIVGGAKHLRYLLDRFHGKFDWPWPRTMPANARSISSVRSRRTRKPNSTSKKSWGITVNTKRERGSY